MRPRVGDRLVGGRFVRPPRTAQWVAYTVAAACYCGGVLRATVTDDAVAHAAGDQAIEAVEVVALWRDRFHKGEGHQPVRPSIAQGIRRRTQRQ